LLTGVGGDEFLGGWRWRRAGTVLNLRARPVPKDLLRIAYAVSPLPIRRAIFLRRSPQFFLPWLKPPARVAAAKALASYFVGDPIRWDRRIEWVARQRMVVLLNQNLEMLGSDANTNVVLPLRDRRFLASWARLGGKAGFPNRTAAMTALFEHLLPGAVIRRKSKANFGWAYWGAASRRFAAAWSGGGVPDIVDEDVLRGEWRKERPDLRTAPLLQAAFLAAGAPELDPGPGP
jgi:hypothetical protein